MQEQDYTEEIKSLTLQSKDAENALNLYMELFSM